ncbi:MAG: MFS transporter [Thermoplasmataceae archaeon]
MARFSSLIAPVPADIDIVFRLADNRSFLTAFGFAMILSLVAELMIQPYLSRVIDRIERRKIQAVNQLVFAISVMTVGLEISLLGHLEAALLIMLVLIETYYTVAYQVYASIAQSLINHRDAGNYSGLSEILGQTPVIIGAAISAIFWNIVPLPYILVASGVVGIFLLFPLARVRNTSATVLTGQSTHSTRPAVRKMKMSSVIFIFLFNMPYVAVVSGNYLKPIFIAQLLHGTPGTLAESEIVYAISAVMAGLLAPLAIKKIGEFRSAMMFSLVYVAGSILMPLFPLIAIFFILQSSHGTGNAGNRISRNTLVMRNVPAGEIGHFNGKVQMLAVTSRILLLLLYILTIELIGVRLLMIITGIMVLAAVTAGALLRRYATVQMENLRLLDQQASFQ